MNWVGGARARVKAKAQVKFKHNGNLSNLGKHSSSSSSGNRTDISRDILNLKTTERLCASAASNSRGAKVRHVPLNDGACRSQRVNEVGSLSPRGIMKHRWNAKSSSFSSRVQSPLRGCSTSNKRKFTESAKRRYHTADFHRALRASSSVPGSTSRASSSVPGSTSRASSSVPGSTSRALSSVPGSTLCASSSVPGSTSRWAFPSSSKTVVKVDMSARSSDVADDSNSIIHQSELTEELDVNERPKTVLEELSSFTNSTKKRNRTNSAPNAVYSSKKKHLCSNSRRHLSWEVEKSHNKDKENLSNADIMRSKTSESMQSSSCSMFPRMGDDSSAINKYDCNAIEIKNSNFVTGPDITSLDSAVVPVKPLVISNKNQCQYDNVLSDHGKPQSNFDFKPVITDALQNETSFTCTDSLHTLHQGYDVTSSNVCHTNITHSSHTAYQYQNVCEEGDSRAAVMVKQSSFSFTSLYAGMGASTKGHIPQERSTDPRFLGQGFVTPLSCNGLSDFQFERFLVCAADILPEVRRQLEQRESSEGHVTCNDKNKNSVSYKVMAEQRASSPGVTKNEMEPNSFAILEAEEEPKCSVEQPNSESKPSFLQFLERLKKEKVAAIQSPPERNKAFYCDIVPSKLKMQSYRGNKDEPVEKPQSHGGSKGDAVELPETLLQGSERRVSGDVESMCDIISSDDVKSDHSATSVHQISHGLDMDLSQDLSENMEDSQEISSTSLVFDMKQTINAVSTTTAAPVDRNLKVLATSVKSLPTSPVNCVDLTTLKSNHLAQVLSTDDVSSQVKLVTSNSCCSNATKTPLSNDKMGRDVLGEDSVQPKSAVEDFLPLGGATRSSSAELDELMLEKSASPIFVCAKVKDCQSSQRGSVIEASAIDLDLATKPSGHASCLTCYNAENVAQTTKPATNFENARMKIAKSSPKLNHIPAVIAKTRQPENFNLIRTTPIYQRLQEGSTVFAQSLGSDVTHDKINHLANASVFAEVMSTMDMDMDDDDDSNKTVQPSEQEEKAGSDIFACRNKGVPSPQTKDFPELVDADAQLMANIYAKNAQKSLSLVPNNENNVKGIQSQNGAVNKSVQMTPKNVVNSCQQTENTKLLIDEKCLVGCQCSQNTNLSQHSVEQSKSSDERKWGNYEIVRLPSNLQISFEVCCLLQEVLKKVVESSRSRTSTIPKIWNRGRKSITSRNLSAHSNRQSRNADNMAENTYSTSSEQNPRFSKMKIPSNGNEPVSAQTVLSSMKPASLPSLMLSPIAPSPLTDDLGLSKSKTVMALCSLSQEQALMAPPKPLFTSTPICPPLLRNREAGLFLNRKVRDRSLNNAETSHCDSTLWQVCTKKTPVIGKVKKRAHLTSSQKWKTED